MNAPVEEKKPFIKRRDSIGIVNKRKLAPRSSSGLDQKIKEELDETIFLSSDDEDDKVHGQRINIEFINLDSDEEDGDGPHNSLRPVFVERREHVDRSVEVKLQTSLAHAEEAKRQAERKTEEMQADSLFFSDDDDHSPERRRPRKTKDFEILGSHRRWRGMYEDEDGMHADGGEYFIFQIYIRSSAHT